MDNQRVACRFITAFVVIICMTAVFSQELMIEPNVRNLLVPEYNRTVLDCYITTLSKDSASNLVWSGPNHASLNKLQTMTHNEFTYHSVLTIESFKTGDEGDYSCKYGDKEAKITLYMVIERKSEAEFFFGNKSTVLECTIEFTGTSIQATFQQWLKDNSSVSQLKLPERFTDYKNGTLLVSNPARSDAGLYSARYSILIEGVTYPHYDCNVTFLAAPLVLDMSKSKNVVEDTTLHLECKVKGYPLANVTWLKNNETLQEDRKRIFMDSFPDYERLTIHSVSSSDEGRYTCLALDMNGHRSSKNIFVRVKDRLEWLWPVIGIICEIIVLAIIIYACSKIKKDDHTERPADEREGLLRQGSGRNRDHDKNN